MASEVRIRVGGQEWRGTGAGREEALRDAARRAEAQRERERAAVKRARRLGGPALVRRLALGRYVVPSASDQRAAYVVAGAGPFLRDYRCSCEAGRHDRVCWHVASVHLRRLRENSLLEWRSVQRRRAAAAPMVTAASTAAARPHQRAA